MTALEQIRVQSGDDGLAYPLVDKLRCLIPAAGAISYPFWLDAFHLAVAPPGGPMSGCGYSGRRFFCWPQPRYRCLGSPARSG